MPQRTDDRVLVSGRREAIIVFVTWIMAMAYSLIYCSRYAYGRRAEEIQYVYGFPDWVFWGVVVPWGVCVLFSWFFASILMRDEDLGEDPPGSDSAGELGLDS